MGQAMPGGADLHALQVHANGNNPASPTPKLHWLDAFELK